MHKKFDNIVIGAGIYGLYAAQLLSKKNKSVLVLEYDSEPILRATYINQARVHNGYHYPRSYSTAIKTVKYFERFLKDFDFAINKSFDQIYATSTNYSYTNAKQFQNFCNNCNIKCEEISPKKYFKDSMVDGAFLTEEYAVDAAKLRHYFAEELKSSNNVRVYYDVRILSIEKKDTYYKITLDNGDIFESECILNATYASTNQISNLARYEGFKIKYEICEIILGKTTPNIKSVGLTVMDGPFFSVMPFGLSEYSSLTSVTFTPHKVCYDKLPTFDCQKNCKTCSSLQLDNCNLCLEKPKTSFPYMYALMKKYLNEDICFDYINSLFSIKPILMESEVDDSRPTVIKEFSQNPSFISVLSGKINTIYDLEDVL